MKPMFLLALLLAAIGCVVGFSLGFPLSSAMLSRLDPYMRFTPSTVGHQQFLSGVRIHYAQHLAFYTGLLFAAAPLAVIASGSKTFKVRKLLLYLLCGITVSAGCYWFDFVELSSPLFEIWGHLSEAAFLTTTRHPLNGILVIYAVALLQRFIFPDRTAKKKCRDESQG